MKHLYRYLLVTTALLSAVTSFADVPLKMIRGTKTTSTTAKFDVIAQTSPDATATINGEQMHVYQTGAFGKQVTLKEGANTIKIVVNKGKETKTQTLSVTYTPKAPVKTAAPADPVFVSGEFNAKTLEGAYLTYGTGTDRLGGSKMGYVSAGIPIKVLGKCGDLYRVKLSENRYAYMDEDYLEKGGSGFKTVNSGSISIANGGNGFDVVSVSLPQRVLYSSFMELDPSTICVDLYGVTNNSNWITHRMGLGMIDWVDARQIESDVLRLEIKLQKKHAWGYAISYTGNALTIKVKHAPTPSLNGLRVGLDAGHGGSNNGAVSLTGAKEKELNLDIVYKIKAILEEKGAIVTLTRKADETVSMTRRKEILVDAGADLLISIHNNAGGGAFKSLGTSTYYKHLQNRELTCCIMNRLVEMGLKEYGITGNFNFALGMPTEFPTMLVEGLFLDNMPDEEIILNEEKRQTIAEQVVAGLEDYLQRVKENE